MIVNKKRSLKNRAHRMGAYLKVKIYDIAQSKTLQQLCLIY